MLSFRRSIAMVPAALAVVFLSSAVLRADDAKDKPKDGPKPAKAESTGGGLWNPDVMMETAVQQLTRRYNLNKDQEAYTRKLLVGRVKDFLKANESELRGLLTEALDLQMHAKTVDAKRMREWADRALPVFAQARVAILDGNKEWGEILNPDQKKIHQMDLDQMGANFKDMDEKFTRWSKGGFKPEDLTPRVANPRPPISPSDRKTTPTGPLAGSTSIAEDVWELYVNQIIGLYKYTKAQENSARGILTECRAKATRYRDANKDRISELEVKVRTASNAVFEQKGSAEDQRKAQVQLDDMMRPITQDMFNELKSRVEALATAEQKATVATAKTEQKKALDASRKAWEERAAKMRAPSTREASTQEASSQPATPKRIVLPPPAESGSKEERAAAGG